ncbi:unnamed protein product [Somion occarium]|uniref:SigF-like NTF2-like domain-containing protein n=1 Tax=Somion occarium TaxID=3059160 RepID=A0ABP1D3X5_9APHY
MQDPAREIVDIIINLTAALDPDTQKAAVETAYAPDAAFRHPFCLVPAGPHSRDAILGIYQAYRVLSPKIVIQVPSVTYDADKDELFVEVVQYFQLRCSPINPAPARLLVHLKLRRSDEDSNLHVIAEHDDFYHPDALAALLFPPLVPVVRGLLRVSAMATNMQSRLGAFLGVWKVQGDEAKKTS